MSTSELTLVPFKRASSYKDLFRRQSGYVPYAAFDPASTGRQTREGSRTLEVGDQRGSAEKNLTLLLYQYAFNDFGVRQVALLLNKSDDVSIFTNQSLVSLPTLYCFTSN